MTWSNYFNAYIKCVKYISDTDWYFVIVGDTNSRIHKAKSRYSTFNWII